MCEERKLIWRRRNEKSNGEGKVRIVIEYEEATDLVMRKSKSVMAFSLSVKFGETIGYV